MEIHLDDASHPSVLALLERHEVHCEIDTACDKRHRLDVAALRGDDIRFWVAWEGEVAIGCVALRDLGAGRGEVKTMHVLAENRGAGIADSLIAHLFGAARAAGFSWLGLETGDTASFHAAVAFYRRHGFDDTAPFGDYTRENSGILMARTI